MELIDEKEEYEVEAVLNHKNIRSHPHYLMKWVGYSTAENSWEPESNLTNAQQLLETYKKDHNLHQKAQLNPVYSSFNKPPPSDYYDHL